MDGAIVCIGVDWECWTLLQYLVERDADQRLIQERIERDGRDVPTSY